MKVLVTGATGFVGRALVQRLAQADHEVFSAARRAPAGAGATHVELDLSVPIDPRRLPEQCDVVVWLAQSPRYREFPAGARDVFEVNCRALFDLLEWARGAGVGRFMHASSGSVYAPSAEPIPEAGALDPQGFYARSKLVAEQLAGAYATCFDVCALRVFAPYGPGQAGKLIPGLIERVRQDVPVDVTGGEGLRLNPIFIDDLIEALVRLLQVPQVPAALNVGGRAGLSIRAMAEAIGQGLGREVRFRDAPAGPCQDRVGDIRALLALLPGFTPRSFAEGTALTLQAGPL